MDHNLYRGKFVRLVAEDADKVSPKLAAWNRDTEFWRLQAAEPARASSSKAVQKWIEEDMQADPNTFFFLIRSLSDDRLLGQIDIEVTSWIHKDAFVGIGIGGAQDWGRGYGTDAMRLMLKFAFAELGLQRVSLTVFEYNLRAIRAYEKIGFVHEGSLQNALLRAGRRWNLAFMGITLDEWKRAQAVFSAASTQGGVQ